VWLCKRFVERLYEKLDDFNLYTDETKKKKVNLNKTTDKFDKCGFKMNLKKYIKDEEGMDTEVETEDITIEFPSRKYKNVYALLDDPDLKPAFFKEYVFRVDYNEVYNMKEKEEYLMEPKVVRCFNSASYLATSFAFMSATALAVLIA